MARRKQTNEELEFIKKVPEKYRISVLVLFQEFRDENNWATPLNIISEITENTDLTNDEVHEALYDKMDKLKQGRLTAKNDPVFFNLIGDFLWRNNSEKLSSMFLPQTLKQFGNVLTTMFCPYEFLDSESVPKSQNWPVKGFLETHPRVISYYELEAKKNEKYKDLYDRENAIFDKPKETHNIKYYFAILCTDNFQYDIVISFDDAENNDVYFGVYFPNKSMIFLKGHIDDEPLYIRFDKDSLGIDTHPRNYATVVDRKIVKPHKRGRDHYFPDYFGREFENNNYDFVFKPIEASFGSGSLRDKVNTIIKNTCLDAFECFI